MPTFEQARTMILERVSALNSENVALLDALGRVLAEDMAAPWDLPSFSNSAMDGYAVRAADCAGTAGLPITDYVPAGGCAQAALRPGSAIKIMTGAPIPEECDSVVPLEDAREEDGAVYIQRPVVKHQHVRFAGEDIRRGDLFLQKGAVIRPMEVSVLASFGKKFVPVFRRPKVAIVATGDELVELGQTPANGKIINSNSYGLAAAVRSLGALPVIMGIARDNPESHREKFHAGLQADALITSAGVSVGDRDFVRQVLAELGVEPVFWRVEVKPGKALAFGVRNGTPVFALPGNPVSTMLTFEEFVAPALRKMMGHRQFLKQPVCAELGQDFKSPDGRTHLARVRIEYVDGRYVVHSAGKQETGSIKTLLHANGVAVLQPGHGAFAAGEHVPVHFLADEPDLMKDEGEDVQQG